MGLRMKNFSTMGGSLKNPIFRRGGSKKLICKGELPKKGDLDFRGVDTLMHTICDRE